MGELKVLESLVAVFGPVGGVAVVACFLLWRALNKRTDQLVEVSRSTATALTAIAVKIEKKDS
jgi:hypothetical protein